MGGPKEPKRYDSFHGNATVGAVEKKIAEELGVPKVTLMNSDGTNTRSDKLLKNYRKDHE